MKIQSLLPVDRRIPGSIAAFADDGFILLGPAPCRGKADNLIAAAHKNPTRDPKLSHGDHPYGGYVVLHVDFHKMPVRSYGSAFLLLDPRSGDAYIAAENGRLGLAIHGGDLNSDGSLRATEGCLRVTNDFALALGQLVQAEIEAGRSVPYTCSQPPAEPAEEVS